MRDTDSAFREMRSHERFEVSRVVHVTDLHTGHELGQLVNYSEQGIMIVGTQPVAENSVFQLSLLLEDADASQSIELGVESLWSNSTQDRSCCWTGFYIIDISEESQARLTTLLG
jgi:PilZ domain